MERYSAIFLLFICFSLNVFSQTLSGLVKVEVKLKDSETPLEYCGVTVILGDSTRLSGITDKNGRAIISIKNKFLAGLMVTHIGYKPFSSSEALPYKIVKDTIFLKPVYLEEDNLLLKEVSINATRILVHKEEDKIVYDVEHDPDALRANLFSVIQKVPFINLDMNQNIQLKGSGKFKVLLDGRPTSMFVNSPSQALKGIPASSIKRIEVLEDIPQKYVQEGLIGLLNIVTKRGLIGALSTNSLAVEIPFSKSASSSTILRNNKVSFSMQGGVNWGDTIFSSRTSNLNGKGIDWFTRSSNDNLKSISHTQYVSGDFSYEVDSLNIFSFSGKFDSGNTDQFTQSLMLQQEVNGVGLLKSGIDRHQKNRGMDFTAGYQHNFRKKRSQYFSLLYQYNHQKLPTSSFTKFLEQQGYQYADFKQYTDQQQYHQVVQADVLYTIQKIEIEHGIKSIWRRSFNDFKFWETGAWGETFISDRGVPYQFDQDIYSYYSSLKHKLGKIRIRVGFNHEFSINRQKFLTQLNTINLVAQNFIPTISFSRSISPFGSVSLGYNFRVLRPTIEQISPYQNLSDPLQIYQGNPGLNPEKRHTFNLGYSNFKGGFLSTGLSYSILKEQIVNLSDISEQTNIIAFTNLEHSSSIAYNLNLSRTLLKKVNVNLMLLGGYHSYKFSGNRNSNGITLQTFTTATMPLNSTFRLSLYHIYNGPYKTFQAKNQSSDSFILNLSGTFLKQRLNGNLSLNNIWANQKLTSNSISSLSFNQYILKKEPQRSCSLSLSYKIGSLKSKEPKNFNKNILLDDQKSINQREKIN